MLEEPRVSRFGNEMYPTRKQLLLFLIGWIGFQIFATTLQIIILVFAKIYWGAGEEVLQKYSMSMLINGVAYLGLLFALVLISQRDIVKLLKSFKHYQSFIAGAVCLVAMFAFNALYSAFLSIIKVTSSDNANESSLQSLQDVYPLTCLIIFGIVGPICEELTYRVGLFSLLKRKNKVVAYVVTILVFAFIHFNFSLDTKTLLNELLNLPYYMFAAAAFSFTYDKFGFAGSVTAHISNNLISLFLIRALI